MFLYTKPIRGENTPYIYREYFGDIDTIFLQKAWFSWHTTRPKTTTIGRCKPPKAPPTSPSPTCHRQHDAHQEHAFRTPTAKPLTTSPSLSPRYRWDVSSLHATGNIATCDMQRDHIQKVTEAPHIHNPSREQEMKFSMLSRNAYCGIRNEPNTKQKRCKKQSLTPL